MKLTFGKNRCKPKPYMHSAQTIIKVYNLKQFFSYRSCSCFCLCLIPSPKRKNRKEIIFTSFDSIKHPHREISKGTFGTFFLKRKFNNIFFVVSSILPLCFVCRDHINPNGVFSVQLKYFRHTRVKDSNGEKKHRNYLKKKINKSTIFEEVETSLFGLYNAGDVVAVAVAVFHQSAFEYVYKCCFRLWRFFSLWNYFFFLYYHFQCFI